MPPAWWALPLLGPAPPVESPPPRLELPPAASPLLPDPPQAASVATAPAASGARMERKGSDDKKAQVRSIAWSLAFVDRRGAGAASTSKAKGASNAR
jgi:hypothetical protein